MWRYFQKAKQCYRISCCQWEKSFQTGGWNTMSQGGWRNREGPWLRPGRAKHQISSSWASENINHSYLLGNAAEGCSILLLYLGNLQVYIKSHFSDGMVHRLYVDFIAINSKYKGSVEADKGEKHILGFIPSLETIKVRLYRTLSSLI